jgi:hypothetical protein
MMKAALRQAADPHPNVKFHVNKEQRFPHRDLI